MVLGQTVYESSALSYSLSLYCADEERANFCSNMVPGLYDRLLLSVSDFFGEMDV
jgi:hypothetical protein